jgi:hypothetical protein
MKQRKMNIFKSLFLATLFMAILISSAGGAHAALSIEYSVGGAGSIYYDPMQNNFLNGTGLMVTGVTGNETALNSGMTLPITNGLLNFQTGAFTGKTGNVWNFDSAGTIALQGGISAINVPANTTLLTGSFLSASVTELSLGSYQFDIVGATFGNTDNPSIYQYYGVPTGSIGSGALNLSFIGTSNAGGGFTSTNNFGGVVVDSPTPVPIPAVAWLLGSGFIGLVGIRNRTREVKGKVPGRG